MSQRPVMQRAAAEKVVKDIRRATRKQHSAEEKVRIVLAGLRGGPAVRMIKIALCDAISRPTPARRSLRPPARAPSRRYGRA